MPNGSAIVSEMIMQRDTLEVDGESRWEPSPGLQPQLITLANANLYRLQAEMIVPLTPTTSV